MKRKLYYLLFLFSFTPTLFAQTHFQSALLLEDFTAAQVDSFLQAQGVPAGTVDIQNGVQAYRITYSTVSYDSSATVATGTLFLPQGYGNCQKPILNYCHGTIIKKLDAPSYKVGEYVVGICFSATGYICIMPDYLGLGPTSPGLHPYIHAHSEATASIDMIRASKEYMDSVNFAYSDQLFLTGYSQGGHASLATHRMMQEDLSSEFTVTASAPLSGPYDVSGVQAEVITKDSSYGAPGYLPFVLFSYNMVYNLYSNWDAVLDTPYNSTVPPLMDGSVTLGFVENFIPDTPNLIILPSLLDSFENFMNHPFRQALYDNDLYRWAPQCPTRFGYCVGDELVSYKNAIVCRDSMIAYGATDVDAFMVSPTLGHGDCALFALQGVGYFFTPFRQDIITVAMNVTDESVAGAGDGFITTTVTGGAPGYTFVWNDLSTDTLLTGLGPGTYSVTVTDANGCTSSCVANVGVVGLENEVVPSVKVYPNPATSIVSLGLSNFEKDLIVSIITPLGKVQYTKAFEAGSSLITLPVDQLSKGVYIIRITSGNYQLQRSLIIE